MLQELSRREERLREFFCLDPDTQLLGREAMIPDITPSIADHLAHFNIEWHIIPSENIVPFDDRYLERLYPMRTKDF